MLLTDLSRKADEGFIKNRDSERRVFYVGATRAKKSLHIIRSNSSREFTEIFQWPIKLIPHITNKERLK